MEHFNLSINPTTADDLILTNRTLSSKKMIPAAVLGLCCLVGLPSNIMVIISIARKWNRDLSFTLKLMLNLAVSDTLSLCLAPVVIYGVIFGWTLGLWPCRILFYLGYSSMYVGVLTVTCMSVHFYHHVIKSKTTNRMIQQRLEGSRRCLQLIGLWILAFAFAVPVLFTRGLKDKSGSVRCQRTMESVPGEVTVLLFEVLLGFVIPFSIMLTSYLWLHKGLSQNAKSSSATTTQKDQKPGYQKTKVRGYKKRLVISIVAAFFLFWTPVHVINVIDIVTTVTKTSNPHVYDQLKSFRRVSGDTSKTLALINCCLNPFLYAISSWNLIKCCKRQR